MSYQYRVFLVVAVAVLTVVLAAASTPAQISGRIPITDAAKNRGPAPSGPRIKRAVVVTKVYQKPIIKTEKVKINSLSVTTEPAAKVILESAVKAPKAFKREMVADRNGSAIFEDIPPGNYNIQSSKDGFKTSENDKVSIVAQKAQNLPMDLDAITYKLKIQTNLRDGQVYFAQAVQKGKDAAGAIISEQLGNYCVVKIQPNGEAVITDLKKGYYDIDIQPESLEFEKKATGINLPDDIDQDNSETSGELKTFQIDLAKNQSRDMFSTAWVQADWILPPSWKLDRGMKVRNAEGMALPRNERYRYYVNFEMIANVKLKDDGAIGFVLRAEDPQNYYLVEISGSKADDPNTAVLYAVKKGQRQLLNSATTVSFAKTIASDNGFRVIIQGTDKIFTVWIEDSDTGKTYPVGRLPDQYNTFKKGAIGIAALPKSNFEVNYFQVCTPTCPK